MSVTSARRTPEAPAKRRYDNALRRERAAQTRDRIVDAGAELVHTFSSWDWRKLTFRAVADRAGVHERTVYRHFATEAHLREAVLARLEQEAGIGPEDISSESMREHVATLFRYLASFSSSTEPAMDASLAGLDQRRKAAILAVVSAAAPDRTAEDHLRAAALVDAVWSVATYRRLVSGWGLDTDAAAEAVTWVIELVIDALREGTAAGIA